MRLQLGMAFGLPTLARLGYGGIRTSFILIPQGDATGLCQLIGSFDQTFFSALGDRARDRPPFLRTRSAVPV